MIGTTPYLIGRARTWLYWADASWEALACVARDALPWGLVPLAVGPTVEPSHLRSRFYGVLRCRPGELAQQSPAFEKRSPWTFPLASGRDVCLILRSEARGDS